MALRPRPAAMRPILLGALALALLAAGCSAPESGDYTAPADGDGDPPIDEGPQAEESSLPPELSGEDDNATLSQQQATPSG